MARANRIFDVLLYRQTEQLISKITEQAAVSQPIYVPSSNRAHLIRTHNLLNESKLDYKVVVEPDQERDYAEVVGQNKILLLPESNRGLAYSRNWIIDHAKKSGAEYHWQLDDDIKSFTYRTDGKPHKCLARNALSVVEQITAQTSNVGLCAISHDNFNYTWDPLPPIAYNTTAPGPCSYFRNNIEARCRPGISTDMDYTMQVLHAGLCTIVFKRLGFATVPTGQQAGGLYEQEYEGNKRAERILRFLEYWPGSVKLGYRQNGNAYMMGIGAYYRQFKQLPQAKNKDSFYVAGR